MTPWLDPAKGLFNPSPAVSVATLATGHPCVIVDDALAEPERVVAWASAQRFLPPAGYPYPGLVLDAPADFTLRVSDFFAQHARRLLGARRTMDLTTRLSLVTTPPAQLEPRQWQCHRDCVSPDPGILFAASVLYLFHDPALGGTDFYAPRHSPREIDQLIVDSQRMGAAEFSARHGVAPGYMGGSNAHFERIGQLPARWNRMVFYDGGVFHSADVGQPHALSADPTRGRLTVNSFFTCRRHAR